MLKLKKNISGAKRLMFYSFFNRGPVSLLSIVTGYYLDGPGILSQLGRDFPHISRPARPWSPPSLLYNGYRVFLSWKVRPGRAADHSPPSSTAVKKEYSYTSTPPMGRTACTEPQCLYSTAIPLLPLWAVRPVQSLSACTRVHFNFTFYVVDTTSMSASNGYNPKGGSNYTVPCLALQPKGIHPNWACSNSDYNLWKLTLN